MFNITANKDEQNYQYCMDISMQKMHIFANITKDVLNASLYLQGVLYQCKYLRNNNVNLEPIAEEINNKRFDFEIKGKQIEIKLLKGVITLKFHHCCGRKWIQAGTFDDIPNIFSAYPVTQYEFGVIYNGPMVMPIIVNSWNVGYRITTRDLYPRGDDGNKMTPVRSMWTKGTNDPESKENWYHRYVDQMYKPISANGKMNLKVYARKM